MQRYKNELCTTCEAMTFFAQLGIACLYGGFFKVLIDFGERESMSENLRTTVLYFCLRLPIQARLVRTKSKSLKFDFGLTLSAQKGTFTRRALSPLKCFGGKATMGAL